MSAADPDPFVLLVIQRESGSAEAVVTASPFWDEMKAHEAATAVPKCGQRVWLLDPEDAGMAIHAYVESDDE